MKRVFRLLGILVLAIVGFAVVSYVMFGNDPAARLKLELDHDIPVAGTKIRTISEIDGCDLKLNVSHLDASDTVLKGQNLSVSMKALKDAVTTTGNGFITYKLPEGQTATCTNLDTSACNNANRTEVQLNMPGVKSDDQAIRVIGWVIEIANSCDTK